MLVAIRVVGLAGGIVVASIVPLPSVQSLPFLVAAAATHYVYYALMVNSYRVGDMSQVYPVARGLAPLLIVLLGAFLAGEVLNGLSILAIGIISAGIFALAISGRSINKSAIMFAVCTGVSIAGYSFLSGLGIRKSESLLGYIAWLEIATGVGMVSVGYFRRRDTVIKFARTEWQTGLVLSVISVVGYAICIVRDVQGPQWLLWLPCGKRVFSLRFSGSYSWARASLQSELSLPRLLPSASYFLESHPRKPDMIFDVGSCAATLLARSTPRAIMLIELRRR